MPRKPTKTPATPDAPVEPAAPAPIEGLLEIARRAQPEVSETSLPVAPDETTARLLDTVASIAALVQPQDGEDVVDAVRRLVRVRSASQASSTHFVFNQDAVNPPAPAEAPLPSPSLSDTDDLFIRRTLGSLLGMGPNEATAASMASMLSKKLRAR